MVNFQGYRLIGRPGRWELANWSITAMAIATIHCGSKNYVELPGSNYSPRYLCALGELASYLQNSSDPNNWANKMGLTIERTDEYEM